MEPTEPPPLWALDMAAKASGFECSWQDYCNGPGYGPSHSTTLSIIAHARTLAKYETPPVDPAELKRWQDAREAAAAFWDNDGLPHDAEVARHGSRDDYAIGQVAYIALCHRDGVEPQDKDPGGVA